MSVQAHRLAVHTVPKTMRAAAIDRSGGPEVLSMHSIPLPELDASEVLIAVDTAGVGVWDADMRGGWSPSGQTRFPLVLGSDGAGIVAAVGSRIRRFKPGDKVYAPWTVIETGAARGRKIASWPSLKTDLRNAGAVWVDQEVVVDGNLVSSRKPDDLPAFNRAMIDLFGEARQQTRRTT